MKQANWIDVSRFQNPGDFDYKAAKQAGMIRTELGKRLDLIDPNKFEFFIINNFPMFEYNEEEKKYDFCHNPFSMPHGGIEGLNNPDLDNILAYQMWLEVCKQIPMLAALDLVDFNAPSWFFINTSRTGHSTNLYLPEEHNDKFEWNENDFIYQKTREELIGTNEDAVSTFEDKLKYYTEEVNKIKENYLKNHPHKEILQMYS